MEMTDAQVKPSLVHAPSGFLQLLCHVRSLAIKTLFKSKPVA